MNRSRPLPVYDQFHGNVPIHLIDSLLRDYARKHTNPFKILTGYGASTGSCRSRNAALRSLQQMQEAGLIDGYIPGGSVAELYPFEGIPYYEVQKKYWEILKTDPDRDNHGVIFIFPKLKNKSAGTGNN